MKKALVSYQGYVSEIVNPGEEYEIYSGPGASIQWVDAPDNITKFWTLEWSPGQQVMIWVERTEPDPSPTVARSVAYGQIGAQLDLLWHDINNNGVIDKNSVWFQHISNVKSMIPSPSTVPPVQYITLEQLMAQAATTEPSVDQPPRPSTQEMPSWMRYPGWFGYHK